MKELAQIKESNETTSVIEVSQTIGGLEEKQIVGGLEENQIIGGLEDLNIQGGIIKSMTYVESSSKQTTASVPDKNMTANQEAPENVTEAQFYGRLDLTRQEVDAAEDLDKLITKQFRIASKYAQESKGGSYAEVKAVN